MATQDSGPHQPFGGLGRVLACGLVPVLAIALQACGGSGGGEAEPPPAPLPASLSVTTASVGEAGVPQTFSASAAAVAGLRYEWSFGDGGTSADASPAYAYPRAGEYEVTLRVSNSAGQSRQATTRVSVDRIAHLQGLRCTQPSVRGWCRTDPPQTSGRAIDFIDADNGWAVGSVGAILRTRDGGRTWTPQDSGVATELTAVRFRSASEGYAIGEGRAFLRTLDGGSTWEALVGPQPARSEGAVVHSQSLGFFGPTGIAVYGSNGATPLSASSYTATSTDRGTAWNVRDYAFWRASGSGVLWGLQRAHFAQAGIGRAPLWRSTNQGASFEPVIAFAETDTFPFGRRNALDLIVFDEQRVLVRWDAQSSHPDPDLRPAINMLTSDGGQTWTTFLPAGVPATAQGSLLGHDASGWMISDSAQGCRASTDFGRTWTVPVATPDGRCASYRDGLLVGARWLSLDRGATWRAYDPPADVATSVFSSLRRLGGDTLQIGGWISRDLGLTWAALFPTATSPWTRSGAFAAASASRLVRQSGAGAIQWSTDGGRTWTDSVLDGARVPGSVSFQFVTPAIGWWTIQGFAATQLYRTSDGGATWATVAAAAPTFFVDATRGFGIRNGGVVVSGDGGATWSTPTAAGATPPPERACQPSQFTAARTIRSLAFFDAAHGTLFDGEGGIWVTRDGGATCTRITPYFGDRRTASVARAGSQGLWIVGDDGSVNRSDDRGETWQGVVVGNPLAGPHQWTAVHFFDAQNGWLAGTFGRAAATRDGGRTWVLQRTGLWRGVTQIQSFDARTVWLLGEDGVIAATGTGGH